VSAFFFDGALENTKLRRDKESTAKKSWVILVVSLAAMRSSRSVRGRFSIIMKPGSRQLSFFVFKKLV